MTDRQGLSRTVTIRGRRKVPRKPKFVAKAAVRSRSEDGEGEIVGTAQIEKLSSGTLVVHLDASGMSPDILRRGFSLDAFSVPEEKDEKDSEADL